MPSLNELVDQTEPDNPLRPYLAAMLDAGLIVTLRDGSGRFEAPSAAFAALVGRPGDEARAVGQPFVEGQRFFDEHGRELIRSDHPAQIVRRTGIPQRQRILGVRTARGDEAWLLVSFMPVRPDADGWEVLGIGSALKRSFFRPPTEKTDSDLPCSSSLLAFALAVSGQHLAPEELAQRMKDPVSVLTPAPISVSLMVRRGQTLYPTPVTRYGNHPVVESIPMSADSIVRWDRNVTSYVADLRPTDIVGDRVVIEYEDPLGSFALVPVWDGTERVASLVAASPEAHALSPQQIAGLEALGRLAGPALAACGD